MTVLIELSFRHLTIDLPTAFLINPYQPVVPKRPPKSKSAECRAVVRLCAVDQEDILLDAE